MTAPEQNEQSATPELAPLKVKVPSLRSASARRNAATPFEGEREPSEGPKLACMPTFAPNEDRIHVSMLAAGVVGELLPLCARATAKALEAFVHETRESTFAGARYMAESPEFSSVVEDLQECGGFQLSSRCGEVFLEIISIVTGRGVTFGPMAIGDVAELHSRLSRAFEALPPGAVDRSFVKINMGPARPREIEYVPDSDATETTAP